MSDTALRMQYPPATRYQRTSWGAIWAGVFTFAAVWSVFEALGLAIFPVGPNSAGGISVGMEIWTVVLTIIAMYIAGLETGRLAGVASAHDGLVHGIIMFGLAVVSAAVLMSIGTSLFANGARLATGRSILVPGAEWATFCGLFFGWLAAMGGASTGVTRRAADLQTVTTQPPIQMRPAA